MKGNLIWRLLRKNISVSQIAGYAIANLVGLTIVLTAFQFYRDSTASTKQDEDTFISRDYLIVSKQLSSSAAIAGGADFSPEEIADIASQPWVEKVGEFQPSRYFVSAALTIGGRGMRTHLFFESIPDEFFDIKPDGWNADPEAPGFEIPIIIAKDYLTLYNFGFAASQGMPQLSEKSMSRLKLEITISGGGQTVTYPARIVGFSSRLNTIAIPGNVMDYFNENFADPLESREISRLIIEVNDPGNPVIQKYFTEHSIEVAGDKMDQSKTAYFLSIMSMVVMAIGVVISALAFFILMLSIFLLLQKNKDKIHDLMMLGYTPSQTARQYYLLVIVVNSCIFIASAIIMTIVSKWWRAPFEELGLSCVTPTLTIIAGAVIMALITLVNALAIRSIVRKNF